MKLFWLPDKYTIEINKSQEEVISLLKGKIFIVDSILTFDYPRSINYLAAELRGIRTVSFVVNVIFCIPFLCLVI